MLVNARSDYDVMVPFYDMFNHDNGKYNIRHTIDPKKWYAQIDEEGYEMVTTKAIQAGGQLYNSYDRCNICTNRDWFGTPEIFSNFGFVESMPQRWLFDFARVKFELNWKDEDESTKEIMVKFLVPPSKKGMDMLHLELRRLESFSKEYRDESYEEYEGISEYEWQMIWQYYDALYDALSYALQSGATLSDEVWDLDDGWWVEDGPVKAADEYDHYVLPTRSEKMSNDEL